MNEAKKKIMHPERAARFLSTLGVYLLVGVLIMRVISLVMTTWQTRMGLENTITPPTLPTIGQFHLSSNGKQVIFTRQIGAKGKPDWFYMPLEGGPVGPAEPPPASLGPFQVRDGLVYLHSDSGYEKIGGLAGSSKVVTSAQSPDGRLFAFAATRSAGSDSLYVLSATGSLDWLGDQTRIDEIAWSPDNQNLAFLAAVNDVEQLFVARRDGQMQRQLTDEATNKSDPRWSPDGSTIAYIASSLPDSLSHANQTYTFPGNASPTPVKWSIHLVDINADHKRQFAEDEQKKSNLLWSSAGSDSELLYSVQDQNNSNQLYALNPRTGQVYQAYPPLEITELDCPARIQTNQPGTIGITITNSTPNQAGVSLVLRGRSQPFPAQSALDTNVVQTENVQVPPGTAQRIELPVRAQPGLLTHLSALIDPSGVYAIDEQRCIVKNTFYGLPNLPFLNFMLPLIFVGLVLCIPWLRQQKKTKIWMLYLSIPILTLVMLYLEIRLVGI